MKEPVVPVLTPLEAEALVHFIAKRKELWNREAKDFGVTDPERLCSELVRRHADAVRRHVQSKKVTS